MRRNSFLFKLALELAVTLCITLAYYAVRHLLPKQYRLKDKSIRALIRDFAMLATNMAKPADSAGEILSKSKNIFEHFYTLRNYVNNSYYEFKIFLRDVMEETEQQRSFTFMNLVFPQLEKYGKQEIQVEINQNSHIVKYTFDLNGKSSNFYVIKNINERNDSSGFDTYFAHTKGFDYWSLTNLLFEKFDNRLYLTANGSDTLVAERLELDYNQQDYLIDEKLYASIIEEIKQSKQHGDQRSYIFYGAPGTGKSSLCLELSKRASGRILKLDSKIFNGLAGSSTRALIENLECDFIMVDDVDRITPHDLPAFLYMLECVKSFKRKPTLLATVNDLERLDSAVLRPGRFDEIIEFKLPNKVQRATFIKSILKLFDTTITPEQLTMLVNATEGMSQAYLKEYCRQVRNNPDFERLIKKIKQRRALVSALDTRVDESDVDGDSDDDSGDY